MDGLKRAKGFPKRVCKGPRHWTDGRKPAARHQSGLDQMRSRDTEWSLPNVTTPRLGAREVQPSIAYAERYERTAECLMAGNEMAGDRTSDASIDYENH